MIEDYQLNGLNKILNSEILTTIYPMLDHIEVKYSGMGRHQWKDTPHYKVNIYLNDDSITRDNMYDKEFDPYYLVDHHLKNYLDYLGIDRYGQLFSFSVFSPDGSFVTADS